MTNCPHCGKLTDPKLDNCVHCGAPLAKGAATESAATESGGPKRSQTCPNCGALVQDGDIICVVCGTNLLTGQKIAAEQAPQTSGEEERPQVRSRLAVGGVIAAVIVLIGVAAALVWLRDPVARAERMYREGRLLQAIELLEGRVEQRPDDAAAHMLLGKLHFIDGAYGPAAASFDSAGRLDRTNRDAPLFSALSYAAQGDRSSVNRAIAALRDVVDRDPSNHAAWYLLAQAHGVQGDVDQQREALQKALEIAPSDARTLEAMAVSRALAGDLAGANRDLQLAETELAADPLHLVIKGVTLQLQGQTEPAVAVLTNLMGEAVLDDPGLRSRALVQLGLLHLRAGRPSDARVALRLAQEADSSNRAAQFFHAVALEALDLDTEAMALYEGLARAEGPFAADAAARNAGLHLARQELSLAAETSERAITLGGDTAPIHTIRGRVLAAMDDMTGAREAFRRAIQVDSGYAPAHLENGLLYIKRAQYVDGIRALESYLKLIDPALPDARTNEIRNLIRQIRQTAQIAG